MAYMIAYGVKYAFLSNYEQTVFLKLETVTKQNGTSAPAIYYSDIIQFGEKLNVKAKTVSVRMALAYLVHQACVDKKEDWQIPESVQELARKGKWIREEMATPKHLITPLPRLDINRYFNLPASPSPPARQQRQGTTMHSVQKDAGRRSRQPDRPASRQLASTGSLPAPGSSSAATVQQASSPGRPVATRTRAAIARDEEQTRKNT